MRGKDLIRLGYPESRVIGVAIQVMHQYYKHASDGEAKKILKQVLEKPEFYMNDTVLSKIASVLLDEKRPKHVEIPLNTNRKEYAVFGADQIEMGAINQMEIAMKLPVTVAGALMPDAHQGYGLPIGGVLATENAVIPYGVGVDIGCRMCLSIFDLPSSMTDENHDKLKNVLHRETLFGAGAEFRNPMDDEVLERKEFREIRVVKSLHEKAAKQIGSSGSGNHFVEFGIVEIAPSPFGHSPLPGGESDALKIPPGKYLALLSHSGSRGLGASIANYYTRVAMEKCKLPGVAKHLAWLDLDSEEGQEYWLAMNLAGDYASACHHQIHKKVARSLNTQPVSMVENHHNFAWKETYEGKEVIVHRKGATPAGKGVLGIIPGSMTDPGYVVVGTGEKTSINSASHGAGRKMSRTQAKNFVNQKMMDDLLKEHKITLIGGGLDEAPFAYKDIRDVMNSQQELVDVVGIFNPRIVRMAG